MAFLDSAKIHIKAGNGGKGVSSFYQDKYTRYPRPDGGNGGRGADIIIQASKQIFTLYDFNFRRHFQGDSGGHGSSGRKKGRDAGPLIIQVPAGTIVYDNLLGCMLRDLSDDGAQVVVARGGKGGRGNAVLKKSEVSSPGEGEKKELLLELKLIADVGLVGFPNSGKSTLISKISRAKPKIAGYPFTTRSPILGMVDYEEKVFCVADIPGLIEGSHLGKGLGDRFLRHIERTKLIVQVIDMSGQEGRPPIEDYKAIRKELKSYSPEIAGKPYILVANKMDLDESKENLPRFKKAVREKVLAVSAKKAEGLEELLNAITKKIF